MVKHKRLFDYLLLAVGAILFVWLTGAAIAQNVTQGYSSDAPLQPGMIVQLKPGDPNRIQPLNQKSEEEMLGVVVAPTDAPVALANGENTQQIYVATYGQYNVLVSNQNGVIKAGDSIAVSSIAGVGMKADGNRESIVGKAVESFDGKTQVQSIATLTDQQGTPKSVSIGRIAVNIDVAHNPDYTPVVAQDGVPDFLAQAVDVITNKPVGAIRIYAALVVIILAFIIAAVLLYSGVRNSMTAIGRNPLAKRSIMRNLLQVILLALIVFIIGVIAVYLLLKI